MKLIFSHTRWMILELIRQPAYIVSTLSFPALFYVIFAVPESKDQYSSNLLMASFACFAVFGVLFLQFGVGISQERSKNWYHYLKTFPIKSYHLIFARFISAYFFAVLSVLVIVVIALLFTEASLTISRWFNFFAVLLGAGLVFCLMGLCLGYFSSEKAALPLGNLLYLPLSFAGGLWKPPNILPESLKTISEYLPTRQYGEMAWRVVEGKAIELESVKIIFIYALVFFVVAYIGSKKEVRI